MDSTGVIQMHISGAHTHTHADTHCTDREHLCVCVCACVRYVVNHTNQLWPVSRHARHGFFTLVEHVCMHMAVCVCVHV